MPVTYNAIKQLMLNAVQDTDFVRKNTVLQDQVLANELKTRVEALTPDVVVKLTTSLVTTTSGALSVDDAQQVLVFNPAKAGFALSNFRESTITTPGKINARVGSDLATPIDGTRYMLCDSTRGVLLLDTNLNVRTVYPNFSAAGVAGSAYSAPSSAIVFTSQSVEYIAIAMATHHIVRIYEFATGALFRTIGSGIQGIPPADLNTPVDLAWDGQNLYIACENGQPIGASASNGYVASHNIVGNTTAIFNNLFFVTTGSLLNGEITRPKALHWDGGLWIVNGNNEVGQFPASGGPLIQYINTRTSEYTLGNVKAIKIKGNLVYLANSDYGNIVVVNRDTKKLHTLLGVRSIEDNAVSQTLTFFGNAGSVEGLVPDTIDGIDVVVVVDNTNKRVQRLNEDIYAITNESVYSLLTFAVPLSFKGWCIAGDIPLDMVKVHFRFTATGAWHVLEQMANTMPTQSIQVKIVASMLPDRAIKSWTIKQVTLLAEQA